MVVVWVGEKVVKRADKRVEMMDSMAKMKVQMMAVSMVVQRDVKKADEKVEMMAA